MDLVFGDTILHVLDDTGADPIVWNRRVVENMDLPMEQGPEIMVRGIGGGSITCEWICEATVWWQEQPLLIRWYVMENIDFDLILGLSFLRSNNISISPSTGCIKSPLDIRGRGGGSLWQGSFHEMPQKPKDNVIKTANVDRPKSPVPDAPGSTDVKVTVGIYKDEIQEYKNQNLKFVTLIENQFPEVFSDKLGIIKNTKMSIDVTQNNPISQSSNCLPYYLKSKLHPMLCDMLANNVIEKSNSPWTSPIVIVPKKNNELRLCVDYRLLNSITIRDRYPLPRIEDIFEKLGKACIFSTLDLKAGYWQIPMDVDDKEKTAFITPEGLFQFKLMPFGLVNAPSRFARIISDILNPHTEYAAAYLDDVIIFSSCVGNIRLQSLFLQTVTCCADLELMFSG